MFLFPNVLNVLVETVRDIVVENECKLFGDEGGKTFFEKILNVWLVIKM